MFLYEVSQKQLYKEVFKGPLIKVKFECRKCLSKYEPTEEFGYQLSVTAEGTLTVIFA